MIAASLAARSTLVLCLAMAALPAAAQLPNVQAMPASSADERGDYAAFLQAPHHRAFAIAPGGDWGMATGQDSLPTAEAKAVAACSAVTDQPCRLYAIDDAVIFDRAAWQAAWTTSTAAAAARAPAGTAVGSRFPDLIVTTPEGEARPLSDFAGRVVVLHVWGSWCGPCQQELPDLDRLYRQAAGDPRLVFVPIQARQPIAMARNWARLQGIALPLYDGGGGATFRLAADGSARKFPTTYVLDGRGVVVFAHAGPVERWPDYLPLLIHLADTGVQRLDRQAQSTPRAARQP
jgi:thiol-disulfide isomerase/thioredoxin